MALSQKHRSSLYVSLAPITGTEEAEALLSEFPASDLDTPATKEFVQAELHREIGSLRTDLHREVGALRTEMHVLARSQTQWFCGLLIGAMSVVVAMNAWVEFTFG